MNQLGLDIDKGIPTVTIVTNEFVDGAISNAQGLGVPELPVVMVPHPFGGQSEEALRNKAENAFTDILEVAADWEPSVTELPVEVSAYPAERFEFEGSVEDINEMFFERGWSSGLPIIPPTPERVEAMLQGTSRAPDEILWREVPPRKGILTIELVAVHAVMAGCKPQYMPIIITAMEGLKDPQLNWRALTTTTHPNGILVMVNGPVVEQLGIATGTGAAGPGYHPNVSIGYALSLITDIVGGSISPNGDKSTLGWAGNTVSTVIGEAEAESPWEPYHVEKGFNKDDSVVTVFSGGPPVNWQDHSQHTIRQIMATAARAIAYDGQNSACLSELPSDSSFNESCEVILTLNWEFAQIAAEEEGWSKDDLREYLWENALARCGDPLDPVVQHNFPSPENIQIFVSGGAGKHSQYWQSFCVGQDKTVISVQVEK
ncbi:MAG: UGSC family (seleno)protein [Dehalococcoidales bacterium]